MFLIGLKKLESTCSGAGILGGILIGGAIASFISSIGVVIGIVTNPLFLCTRCYRVIKTWR